MRDQNNKYIEIYPSCNKRLRIIGASNVKINHAKMMMITSRIVFRGKYFIVMFNVDNCRQKRTIAGTLYINTLIILIILLNDRNRFNMTRLHVRFVNVLKLLCA